MSVMHINTEPADRLDDKTICGVGMYRCTEGFTLNLFWYTKENRAEYYTPEEYGHTGFCTTCEERVGLIILAMTDLE